MCLMEGASELYIITGTHSWSWSHSYSWITYVISLELTRKLKAFTCLLLSEPSKGYLTKLQHGYKVFLPRLEDMDGHKAPKTVHDLLVVDTCTLIDSEPGM